MDAIPTFNYDAYPLEQKHQWMQSGPGASAAIGFGDGLSQLGADFAASDTNVGNNLIQRKLADDWQGRASSAAGDAVNRAATSLAGTATPGNTGGASSQRYGDSFTATKNAIPAAPSVGENSWWGRAADELGSELDDMFGTTFGVQSDYSKRLAAYRAADQAANDALRAHEQTTRTALTTYQTAITTPAAAVTGGPGDRPGGGGPGGGGPGAGGGGTGGAGPSRTGPGGPGAGTGGRGGADRPGGPGPTGPPPGGTSPAGVPPVGPPPASPPPTGGTGPTRPNGPPTAPRDPAVFAPGPDAGPGPHRPAPEPAAVPPPVLPPIVGYPGGAGTGHAGGPGVSPLPARPGGGAEPSGGRGPGPGAEPGPAASSGTRLGAGPGPMPFGGFGAGGLGGQPRDHRNNVFIPDDEPFRVEFDDLTPPVIGPPDGS
jgi:hypothetical protein